MEKHSFYTAYASLCSAAKHTPASLPVTPAILPPNATLQSAYAQIAQKRYGNIPAAAPKPR